MVARRGARRCINLACEENAAGGDYCSECEKRTDVQRDHNMRRKQIDDLWSAVLSSAGVVPMRQRNRGYDKLPFGPGEGGVRRAV